MNEASAEPRPLVFVIGTVDNEPDIHPRILKGFEGTLSEVDPKELPPLQFRSVSPDYIFLEKNSPSSIKSSLDGVLKASWMEKHTSILPSVVIILTPFSVDWSTNEWVRRETLLQERYTSLKNVLSSRDVKPFLVAVKIGVGLGIIDQDVMDERIISLKRHLQLDSRTFTFMTQQDLIALSPPMRKLCKNLREFSAAYYSAQIKRVQRNLEQRAMTIQRTFLEGVIPVRYAFKIAFFSDVLGQRSQSLRFYRQGFQALVVMVGNVPPEIEVQLKYVAELLNMKICSWLLQSGQARDAAAQFKMFMSCFKGRMVLVPWRHYAWLADQHIAYVRLLEKYGLGESEEADRSFYYENAAKYTTRRQAAFLTCSRGNKGSALSSLSPICSPMTPGVLSLDSSAMDETARRVGDLKFARPTFLGSLPQLKDRSVGDDSEQLVTQYFEEQEREVVYSSIIMDMLKKAHCSISPSLHRRRAHLVALLGDQHMSEGDFELALSSLRPLVESLCSEGWKACAEPLLRKLMSCAIYLGRLSEYIAAALSLYAMAQSLPMSRYDAEELHRDIMSVLTGPAARTKQSTSSEALTPPRTTSPHYSMVPSRPEFGMAATSDDPATFSFPHGHVIDMGGHSNMFDVSVSFSNSMVGVGGRVRATVLMGSRFCERVAFAEMSVRMNGGMISQRFVPLGMLTREDEEAGGCLEAALEFGPYEKRTFSFTIAIPEAAASSLLKESPHEECLIYADRIMLVLRTNRVVSESSVHDHAEPGDYSDIIFSVCAVPEKLSATLEAARQNGSPITLKDLPFFAGTMQGHTVLHVHPAKATCRVVSPTASLIRLQGPLQRIDVFFSTETNAVRYGKVYLSSDFSPSAPDEALFWYPDTSSLKFASTASAEEQKEALNAALFHPLLLNSSMQPSEPLQIGNHEARSIFCVPLFVRCESSSPVKICLRVEYFPHSEQCSSVSMEYELVVLFVPPMRMDFHWANMSSLMQQPEPRKEFSPVTTVPTAVRGHNMLLSSTLMCLNALERSIDLVSVKLTKADISRELNEESEGSDAAASFAVGGDAKLMHYSMLREVVELRAMEKFVGSADIKFAELVGLDDAVAPTSVLVSVGEVEVQWAVQDDSFFAPPDTTRFCSPGNEVELSNGGTDSGRLLSWLPRVCLRDGSSALENSVARTRVCLERYPVTNVQLVNAPFDVQLHAPAQCALGDVLSIRVLVKNNQWTPERLIVATELCEHYVITGATASAVDVAPKSVATISLSCIPLRCGHVPLPGLRLSWERRGQTIMESAAAPPLFVAP